MIRNNFYIIANNIKPYAFESVKVLALPKGAKFKARFTREWIQNDILTYPHSLTGKHGSYILRDWETDTLVPLRYISVDRINPLGDIFIITYIVGDYIDYKHDKEERITQISKFNESFFDGLSELNPSHSKNNPMSPLVFTSNQIVLISNPNPFSSAPQEQTAEKWINTMSQLSEMAIFDGMAFILPSIKNSANKLVEINDEGSVVLYGGNRYTIEFLHFVVQGFDKNDSGARKNPQDVSFMAGGPYRISINSAFNNLYITPSVVTATGAYDSLTSFISTNHLSSRKNYILIEPTIPQYAKGSYDPVVCIDTTVTTEYRTHLLSVLYLTILFLIFVSIEFNEFVDKKQYPTLSEFLSNFFLVLFSIKLISFFEKLHTYFKQFWVRK